MKVGITDLSKGVDAVAGVGQVPIPDGVPQWLQTALEVVKGIKDLTKDYEGITNAFREQKGTDKVETMDDTHASQPRSTTEVLAPPDTTLKEIVVGLHKACSTMTSMGAGDRQLSEVIMALPFTMKQAEQFLSEIKNRKGW